MENSTSISIKGLLEGMLGLLWEDYLGKVEYARRYNELVHSLKGHVQNDHIALRTLNTDTGTQPAGIPAMLRLFTPLGYTEKGQYVFKNKKLSAIHLEHPKHPELPKIFISQLEVADLSPETQALINAQVKDAKDPLSDTSKALLKEMEADGKLDKQSATQLLEGLVGCFTRPWQPPLKGAVLKVNEESQYGAWTLLHGNAVNHFTAFINTQKIPQWEGIEKTVDALRKAGLPMKKEIEGEPGSKLRQSSTEAVKMSCEVREENGRGGTLEWSYAYYELAERNPIKSPDGKMQLFQGFLGEQATHLFDMTQTKKV